MSKPQKTTKLKLGIRDLPALARGKAKIRRKKKLERLFSKEKVLKQKLVIKQEQDKINKLKRQLNAGRHRKAQQLSRSLGKGIRSLFR